MTVAPTSLSAYEASPSGTRFIPTWPAPTPATPPPPPDPFRARERVLHARRHARVARRVDEDRAGSHRLARSVRLRQVDCPAAAEQAGRSRLRRRADARRGRARGRRARPSAACRAGPAAARAATGDSARQRGVWAVADRTHGGRGAAA